MDSNEGHFNVSLIVIRRCPRTTVYFLVRSKPESRNGESNRRHPLTTQTKRGHCQYKAGEVAAMIIICPSEDRCCVHWEMGSHSLPNLSSSPPLPPPLLPSLINLIVSVDVKHHETEKKQPYHEVHLTAGLTSLDDDARGLTVT